LHELQVTVITGAETTYRAVGAVSAIFGLVSLVMALFHGFATRVVGPLGFLPGIGEFSWG